MTAVVFEFAAAGSMREAERVQICEWLKTLGVNPNHVRSGEVVARGGRYELNLVQHQLNEAGRPFLDATNEIAVTKRAVQLGNRRTWPGAEVTSGDLQRDAEARR